MKEVEKGIAMAGIKNQIAGKIRETTGRITGDEKEELAGKLQQVTGKIQSKVSGAKSKILSQVDEAIEKPRQ